MDGQNTILFARDGFAPAGNALAVTIVSYIEETGAILDADIVVNGKHSFAVLRANTLNDQTKPVSTDGADPSEEEGNQPFDLWHVASHETGHALGLGDVQTNHGAVMYAYSSPGDASNRAPASDDDDGIDAVYGGSVSRSGCGASSVAGTRMRAVDGQVAALLVLGCVARLTLRRRALRAVPVAAALLALTLDPSSAHSASLLPASRVASQATATVVGVATRDVGGVFETTLDLAPAECRSETCPALSRAHAWGGTLGGITQQVGEVPAPKLGERVEVSFSASQERVYEGIPAATLLFRSGSALSR